VTRYRKRPVVIDAVRWTGSNAGDVTDFMGDTPVFGSTGGRHWVIIPTLEGPLRADEGDWIIRGIKGELYPCKSDIFEATYEPIEE
jgi:hypothetical protein